MRWNLQTPPQMLGWICDSGSHESFTEDHCHSRAFVVWTYPAVCHTTLVCLLCLPIRQSTAESLLLFGFTVSVHTCRDMFQFCFLWRWEQFVFFWRITKNNKQSSPLSVFAERNSLSLIHSSLLFLGIK